MKMNRVLMTVAALSAGALVGCGNVAGAAVESGAATDTAAANDGDKISIVTTIFPEYDWVREITAGNDNVDVTMLLDNGVDLHSYQPTAEDIMKISNCDVFVYVGGESDGWVDDALAQSTNDNMQVINLLDSLGGGVKAEEVVEGMQHDEDEHEEEADSEDGEEEVEYDEHVWLSLKNAETLVNAIEGAIETVDADNADLYQSNAESYVSKLADLDQKYQDAVDAGSKDTVLFGDRFPFRYMVDDYNLNYYAAFVGCSAESEASFETIKFLSEKVDELGLNTVLTIEHADNKIAQTVIDNTKNKDAQILAMDSMQSTTSEDVAAGTTYLSVMEGNLDVLTQALK